MAQAEDTELRDLVIEALEKNGSLAKIRALLRANIFLAFEDECTNIKQNVSLDEILKLPEGILSLSIVHEFLEFCNLKNTLFVFMSESRQGKEYTYEGQKALAGKLDFIKRDNIKEPILVTLIKNVLKPYHKKYFDQGDIGNPSNLNKKGDYKDIHKDDQNCTYIVHEDSSIATSNSHSDNSSDEKNKLHLRLQLENSDTDTSSDSTRGRTSSEYIPNEHIVIKHEKEGMESDLVSQYTSQLVEKHIESQPDDLNIQVQNTTTPYYLKDLKVTNNVSSDSTSYIELKPYNSFEEKMINSTGIPATEPDNQCKSSIDLHQVSQSQKLLHNQSHISKMDSVSSATLSSVSSISSKIENTDNDVSKARKKQSLQDSGKSDANIGDYSYDFTSSPKTKDNDVTDNQVQSPKSLQSDHVKNNKNSSIESPHHNSQSSHSSVSISDVADLIEYSEKHSPFSQHFSNEVNESNDSPLSFHNKSKSSNSDDRNKLVKESGDSSESPIPSLSNLSLDIHSD